MPHGHFFPGYFGCASLFWLWPITFQQLKNLLGQVDWWTVSITLLSCSLVLYLRRKVTAYLKYWSGYMVDGVMYWSTRYIIQSLANLDIDSIYVTLILENQGTKRTFNHTDVLEAGNRIRIVGDPGSGKSSFVKRTFRDACKNAFKHPRRSKLPILVDLKDLDVPASLADGELGDWFYEKLRTDAARYAVYQMDTCFDSYAVGPGLLVLLDGLDEVGTTQYPRVQFAIRSLSEKLAQQHESNQIILTMRTQFHQQIKDVFRDSFAQAMFLKPFSPSDIYEFLTRWPFPDRPELHIPKIYNELTDHPTLRELCSNPLILSMYVAENQSPSHLIAIETRTEFYLKVTNELVIRRRLKQTGPALAATQMREQRLRILGRLAYDHLLDPQQSPNTLHLSDAVRVVAEIMHCGVDEAVALFSELSKETGLMTEERPGQTFHFIHLTFCEFLAAFEAVHGRQDGFDQLIQAHYAFEKEGFPYARLRLIEVIPFACGLLRRVQRPEALAQVLKLGDSRLTALSFLETKLYDYEGWPTFVSRERALLSEAGLQSKLVAQWMTAAKPAKEFSDHVKRTPKHRRWFQSWIVDESLFTQVLTIAVNTPDQRPRFPLLSIMREIPPPSFQKMIFSV